MENAYRQGEIFGYAVEPPPSVDVFLDEGDAVAFGDDVALQVRHIPGHSPGSIVLYAPAQNWVIVGDVLFNGGIGRSDLPGGNYDLLINGIKEKLMTLPMKTVVHPGHGPNTSIEQEKAPDPKGKLR
jgi:glyoxylase-like metal-dependent hydrolase (beta-lactamase superfamily II)